MKDSPIVLPLDYVVAINLMITDGHTGKLIVRIGDTDHEICTFAARDAALQINSITVRGFQLKGTL